MKTSARFFSFLQELVKNMSEEPVVIPDLSEWPVFHHKREWFITFIDRRKYFGGTIFGTTQLKED